jgi:hypothetical protein
LRKSYRASHFAYLASPEGPTLLARTASSKKSHSLKNFCNVYVAIAVFDDRIEIRSYGRLPTGITVKQLSGRYDSKPTNPLIAGAFHHTGAVETWDGERIA